MRLKKPIVAVSTIGLLALAACGGGNSSGETGSSPGAAGEETGSSSSASSPSASATTTGKGFQGGAPGKAKNPNLKPPAAPIPGAKKGGTLTVLHNGGFPTIDPTDAYYLESISILTGLVTRQLTQFKYDPKTGHSTLVPDLAMGLGKPNKDFTKWTFTIRKGIKYANGKPVTPEDFKWAINRSFDRATFTGGPQYSNNYFLNGDTYKGPYTDKGKTCGCVEIHGQKLTIKMARPFPDMPYYGTFAAMSPIPKGKDSDPTTYKLHPWATGPYQIKSYEPQHKMVLVKNPNWDPNTDPVRHQYINKFVMKFDMDSSQIDQILLKDNGSAKTTISYDNVLAADYHSFVEKAPDRLVRGPLACTFMEYPDNRKITDVNVRRALAWAWPYKDALVAAGHVLGLDRKVTDQVMPPGIPGREDYSPIPGHKAGQTDPAKAKALLKKAGKMNYTIKWAYETDDPESVAAKDVIVKALKEAGFNPQPVATTSKKYIDSFLQNPDSDINLRAVGWCSDWPSGSSWMPPEFQSTNVDKAGFGSNYEAFSNKAIDKKMRQISTMPLEKQPKAWMDLEKEIMTKYFPVIPTSNGAEVMMRGSKVHGFYDNPTLGMPTWKMMWIG